MAHGTSERKCFTQSTCVNMCVRACRKEINYREQMLNTCYWIDRSRKPRPFTRWDLPLHNLYISYELAWPTWTEILGVKTRGRCQQQYFPTPHCTKWSCTYFIEQQNVEGRGWTGFTNAIAALPTVICLLDAIREKGVVKKWERGASTVFYTCQMGWLRLDGYRTLSCTSVFDKHYLPRFPTVNRSFVINR